MCPYSRQGALFQGKALFGPGFFKPAAIRHRPCTVGAAAAAGRLILCRREMQDQLAELDEGTPGPSCRPPPGLVSEQAPSSWLQHTRQCVEGSRSLRLVIPDPQPVCVLAVQRYLGEVGRCRYHYDITLYDGLVQDTWLLSPELAHLVHDNRLRSGSRAAIGQCSYRYAEKRLRTGAVCIEDMEVRGGTGEGTVPGGQIVPLYGGRKHYLPLWNNDDPYGDIWHRGTEQQGNVSVSTTCSLQKLEQKWSSKKPFLPLRVRIMHKSRLRYFGKVDKKPTTEYPYQAYFEVADHSGMMSVVMWNYLCLVWYNRLQVGNVLLLEKYHVKKSYQKRTLPTTGNTQVKRLPNLEICLNVRDPASKISIIREEDVKPEWNLPDVKYQFVTRSELNNLPHNKVCDVIGLVTYVGRCERKRIKDDGEDFWLYRWVHVIDGTSDQPLPLEIFATSQPSMFENIYPLTYLVCTQMRVVREYPEDAIYLTTSNESQVFKNDYHKRQPYRTDEKVQDFIKWSKTHREADYRGIVTIGGYHPYPQTPTTFAKYCGDNKVEKMISTIDELQTLLGQLQYREHRRVAIQGIIAACRYVGNEELEALEVRSHEELVSFVSVAHHGNPELDTVDQSLSAAQSKCSTGVTTSQSIPEEAVPHSETSNVTVVTRRRKHAAEDDSLQPFSSCFSSTQTELRAASESSNVSMVKRIRIHAVEDLSVNISKSSHTVQYPTRDVNTSIHESLFSEDETTRSSVAENEESDGTLSPGRFWESALWPEVKHNLKSHLHYSTVFPESLLRKFDPKHKEFLLQQYNLHPAKLMKSLCTSDIISQDFSTGGPGHYEVTILGINHDLAIDVCLPVYKNFTLFGSNCLPAQMQCLSTDWNAESQERHWLSLKDELKEYARAQDRLHTICILDICHLGKGKVEIFLNRVYYPITEVLS
ncbi:RPA-related protein RADX isoform X2 [Pyxicephalus adspersus]|uniref:RPA-related protein RADX isoform X2 n=1 Tax=Pyxicephalus adspersus TaxID=30357 RepID=UPI003B5C8A8D